MTKVSKSQRPSAYFLFKILLSLSFPLFVDINPSYVTWESIFFHIGEEPFFMFNHFISFITGLIIMFPCLIFEYHLNRIPISKSVRGRAIIASIVCWAISFLITINRPFLPILFYWPSTTVVTYTPILSITFFVIYPLISRESKMRIISRDLWPLEYGYIRSALKKARREKVLSAFLFVGLVFCPFLIYIQDYFWQLQFGIMSLFFQYRIDYYRPFDIIGMQSIVFDRLIVSSIMMEVVPFVVLLSSLRFIFVRDIFRFQSAIISKSRFISIAILGELLPATIATLLGLIFSAQPAPILFLPIPILPLVGFVFVRFSKFIPIKDGIWPDQEYHMWFEKKREPPEEELPDESIKVPLTYLIVSQLRKLRKE